MNDRLNIGIQFRFEGLPMGGLFGGGDDSADIQAAADAAAKAEREKIEAERELEKSKEEQKSLAQKREQANREARQRVERRSLLAQFDEDEEDEGLLTRRTAEGQS